MIKPLNDCVLVELKGQFSHIATTEKKYDTATSGVVLALAPNLLPDHDDLVGKTVHFEEYKDGTRVGPDKKLALIKYEDIRGEEYDQAE